MEYLRELWKALKRGTPMTRKVFWRFLEILGAISLIVATIAAPFITALIENTVYRTIVWAFFVLLILVFAFSIGLMPYWGMREMKRDKERELGRLADLIVLRKRQRDELLSNPTACVDIKVKNIRPHITTNDGYIAIEYFVTNLTTYDLTFNWEAKQTICVRINRVDMASVHFPIPSIKNKINTLPAGRIDNQLCIEQSLPVDFIPVLREAITKHHVVKWKFHILLAYSFDGESKSEGYYPEWEGIHY